MRHIDPLVSVIIPSYNRAAYIGAAVRSAIAQTYSNVEIIVVDDGSTDNTREILQTFQEQIRYIYQANQGVSVARNTAISASTGDYIALLDSDDVWMPTKLAEQISFLENHPTVMLVAAHAMTIGEHGQILNEQPTYPDQGQGGVSFERVVLDSPLTASAVVVKKDCLPQPLPFTPDVRFEDWEMCLRVAAKHDVGFVAKPLVQYRTHADQSTQALPTQDCVNRQLDDQLGVVARVFPQLPGEPERLQRLRDLIEAQLYASAAIPSYVNGSVSVGADRLGAAIRLDPSTWQGGKRLVDIIANYAHRLAHARDDAEAMAFIDNLFAHLPADLAHAKALRRKVYGHTHVALAFKNYEQSAFANVAAHVWQGVLSDPSWLGNRGVASITMRSLVPPLRRKPRGAS